MTFLDALKTDRPMRRASWWAGHGGDRWLLLGSDGEWWWSSGGGKAKPPTRGDMLADDWEVMP